MRDGFQLADVVGAEKGTAYFISQVERRNKASLEPYFVDADQKSEPLKYAVPFSAQNR